LRARIKWVEGAAWTAESDSGHGLVVDGSPDIGGRNLGPRPMELVLMGLGSCSAMDVISILRKARQAVTDCVITLDAERADTIPKVFTRIEMHYTVTGHDLDPAVVARAVNLSADKYCSVSRMLKPTVEITHHFEVLPAASGTPLASAGEP